MNLYKEAGLASMYRKFRRNRIALVVANLFAALLLIVILHSLAGHDPMVHLTLIVLVAVSVLLFNRIQAFFLRKYLKYDLFRDRTVHESATDWSALETDFAYSEKLCKRIALSDRHVYNLGARNALLVFPIQDIVWIYQTEERKPQLILVTKDRTRYSLAYDASLFFPPTHVLPRIHARNSGISVGFTAENRKMYQQRFNEMVRRAEAGEAGVSR